MLKTLVVIPAYNEALNIKKTVIDPIEEKEDMIEENRKKAMRKRIAR